MHRSNTNNLDNLTFLCENIVRCQSPLHHAGLVPVWSVCGVCLLCRGSDVKTMLHFLWLFWEGTLQLCVHDLLCACANFYFTKTVKTYCASMWLWRRDTNNCQDMQMKQINSKLISSSQWFHNNMFLMSFFMKRNSSDLTPALITSSAFFVLLSQFLQVQIHTQKMECDPEKSPMNDWLPSFHNNVCRNPLLCWGRTDTMAWP